MPETDPWIRCELNPEAVLGKSVEWFDRDGFDLCELEQYWHRAAGLSIGSILLRPAMTTLWMRQARPFKGGVLLDHAFIITRYGYDGMARRTLEKFAPQRPELYRLLRVRPIYGIDLSIEWVSKECVTELFHAEIDRASISEIAERKGELEKLVARTDWEAHARDVIEHRAEWEELDSDAEGDWKVQRLGWPTVYNTMKVYR